MTLNQYQDEHLTGLQALVFAQPGGPGTTVYVLPCTSFSDAANPKVGRAPTWVADPKRADAFLRSVDLRSAPDLPGFTMAMPVGKAEALLEELARKGCKVPIYVVANQCEPRDMFMNYDRVWAYAGVLLLTEDGDPIVQGMGEDSARMEKQFAANADYLVRLYKMRATRQATTSVFPIVDMHALEKDACAGICGPGSELCDERVAVHRTALAATAEVRISTDGGITWTATTADPFTTLIGGAAPQIAGVEVVWRAGGVRRIICSHGTTNPAAAAMIAYSDDEGATAWKTVTLGATAAYFTWNQALFALDEKHIWAGLSDGTIYFSRDGAETWTQQDAGTNTVAINAIHMFSEKVGIAVGGVPGAPDTFVILYTEDGGMHWSEAPDMQPGAAADTLWSCICFGRQEWYVGADSGVIYWTRDGGQTWDTITPHLDPTHSAAGPVWDMRASNRLVWWIANEWNDGADDFGSIQRTFNGGMDFEAWNTVALDDGDYGLTCVFPCHENHAFAGGNLETTAVIMDVHN